jgi:Fe-S cluster biogenesis protein NfuA
MSTDAPEESGDDTETLAEEIETWLVKQMPIIQMHGGTSNVRKADPESGEVVIELGGGCAGCDVADITAGNIEADLIKKYPDVTEVTVRVPDSGEAFGVDQKESIMGVDRTEGGRGDFKDGRW